MSIVTLLLILVIPGGIAIYEYMKNGSTGGSSSMSTQQNASNSQFLTDGYPDISPQDQGGNFDTTYDQNMLDASQKHNVPFALIKAHAIRESSLRSNAFHNDYSDHSSYGLMQVEWWPGSGRLAKFGYPDSEIGDGSMLYDPETNCDIGAGIIKANLDWLGNLRDAINAYNTGVPESEREAPDNYVNDVLGYYSTLVGSTVT